MSSVLETPVDATGTGDPMKDATAALRPREKNAKDGTVVERPGIEPGSWDGFSPLTRSLN